MIEKQAQDCRGGESVRIQVKHLEFGRNMVFFPAENTQIKRLRTRHLPAGLMSEVPSMLRQEGILPKG